MRSQNPVIRSNAPLPALSPLVPRGAREKQSGARVKLRPLVSAIDSYYCPVATEAVLLALPFNPVAKKTNCPYRDLQQIFDRHEPEIPGMGVGAREPPLQIPREENSHQYEKHRAEGGKGEVDGKTRGRRKLIHFDDPPG